MTQLVSDERLRAMLSEPWKSITTGETQRIVLGLQGARKALEVATEALEPASKLADAVDAYRWIYMLMDDEIRDTLYDAMMEWRKLRKSLTQLQSGEFGGGSDGKKEA